MANITGPVSVTVAVNSLTRTATQGETPLGTKVQTQDGEYMYVKAAGAVTASGDAVAPSGLIQSTGGIVRAASTTLGFLGVAEAPFASGEYGYIKTKGFVNAVVASGTTANSLLQTTTASGVLGNITTSGTGIGIALEANTGAAAAKAVYLLVVEGPDGGQAPTAGPFIRLPQPGGDRGLRREGMLSMASAVKKTVIEDDMDAVYAEAAATQVAADNPMSPQDQINLRMVEVLEGLARKNATGPIPQVPINMYKAVTPWNPTGKRKRATFNQPTFLNGIRLSNIMHSDEEIEKINQLKPGKYYNRKIVVWQADTTDGDNALHLQFPNKTNEHKFEMAQLAGQRGLTAILDVILAEQAAVVPAH